ncbi:ketopantoate reductase family protein [Massilibacterium senegalense]|uniref:ketopantoate reductase family protein n=1 Tax=Massilibacterium senegalense TaxID=1632858 RepID=UPI000782A578|nr:2-dehydropantoate 2-reductase [Massilibacterium senegalense]
MKIVVIGAGAVGGYYGARLAEAGADVTFLVRANRFKQLKEEGLYIESVNGNTSISDLKMVTEADEVKECDLVILAVKGYHLEGTFPTLDELVKRGAKILPLLNGYEHYPILQEKYGKENVLGGLCFIISTLNEKGHILHTTKNDQIIFGALHESQHEWCEKLKQITTKANMTDKLAQNILFYIWRKYAFIVPYSAMTTTSRRPIGAVREKEMVLSTFQDVAMEMYQLAKSFGVQLEDDFRQVVTEQITRLPYESTSSMHQDLRKNLFLEVEHLQGGALRLANQQNVTMPKIETLYSILKLIESPEERQ